MRTLIVTLLCLASRDSVALAQREPPVAQISEAGAQFTLPSSWLSQHPDSVYWILSWSRPGHEIAWRMGDEGIAVTVPDSVVRRAAVTAWGRAAQQRFYRGNGGFITQDDPTPADVQMEETVVHIQVHPGPVLESLLRLRPDSLRVDRGYWRPHSETWLPTAYQ